MSQYYQERTLSGQLVPIANWVTTRRISERHLTTAAATKGKALKDPLCQH
jgi:hypothetical protein